MSLVPRQNQLHAISFRQRLSKSARDFSQLVGALSPDTHKDYIRAEGDFLKKRRYVVEKTNEATR